MQHRINAPRYGFGITYTEQQRTFTFKCTHTTHAVVLNAPSQDVPKTRGFYSKVFRPTYGWHPDIQVVQATTRILIIKGSG